MSAKLMFIIYGVFHQPPGPHGTDTRFSFALLASMLMLIFSFANISRTSRHIQDFQKENPLEFSPASFSNSTKKKSSKKLEIFVFKKG